MVTVGLWGRRGLGAHGGRLRPHIEPVALAHDAHDRRHVQRVHLIQHAAYVWRLVVSGIASALTAVPIVAAVRRRDGGGPVAARRRTRVSRS